MYVPPISADPLTDKSGSLSVIATDNAGNKANNGTMLAFEIQHDLQGRLRLKADALNFNENLAASVVEAVQSIEGVTSARVNSWCASLIITFDKDVITRDFLLDDLENRIFPEAGELPAPAPTLLGKAK